MYPIAIVAALGIAVAIERYLYLSRTESGNKRLWNEVSPFLAKGDYRGAQAATERFRQRDRPDPQLRPGADQERPPP